MLNEPNNFSPLVSLCFSPSLFYPEFIQTTK